VRWPPGPGAGVIGAVRLPGDRGALLVAVCPLGDLPPLAGWDCEHRLQCPAGRFHDWHARELNRVRRPGGGGAREDPADAQTLAPFCGHPHQLDGVAQPLGQERHNRVWAYVRRAAQHERFSGRLGGPGPHRDHLHKQWHDSPFRTTGSPARPPPGQPTQPNGRGPCPYRAALRRYGSRGIPSPLAVPALRVCLSTLPAHQLGCWDNVSWQVKAAVIAVTLMGALSPRPGACQTGTGLTRGPCALDLGACWGWAWSSSSPGACHRPQVSAFQVFGP
jgi:hypothetical protein